MGTPEADTGVFVIKCQECESESQWQLRSYLEVRVSFIGRSHLAQHGEELGRNTDLISTRYDIR